MIRKSERKNKGIFEEMRQSGNDISSRQIIAINNVRRTKMSTFINPSCDWRLFKRASRRRYHDLCVLGNHNQFFFRHMSCVIMKF